MLRSRITYKTVLKVNQSQEGETVEMKMERIVDRGEPITDGAPIIHQERDEGVRPEYDIRRDRWEMAIEATDRIGRDQMTKRVEMKVKKSEGSESTQGTESQETSEK